MERENMKMGTVFTGMTKMCTDSAANLIGKTVQQWQKSSWRVDWQSAPYSQNQNAVESKIEALFARGISNLKSSGLPFMLCIFVYMIYMAADAMNCLWTKAINMAPITAMYRYIAHISDFMPPGAKMFCYLDESPRLKGEDHQEIMWYCGRPRTGGGFFGFCIENCKVYVRNHVNFDPRFLYILTVLDATLSGC
jgi:hypothetical protein